MSVLNKGIAARPELIAANGIVALFAPDAVNVSADGKTTTYTESQQWIDFGEVQAAGNTGTTYTPNEEKITGRRLNGDYTAKVLSSNLDLGFTFGTIHAWSPELLALHRGTAAPTLLPNGVQMLSAVPKEVRGQFLWLEAGDEATDIIVATYHPLANLKGDGDAVQNNVKVLKFAELSQPYKDAARVLPAGYNDLTRGVDRGATYILNRNELKDFLTALGAGDLLT